MAAGTFTVISEIRIDAAPEAIFPFLTDPQKIVRWKGVDATVEASPGGVYRVNVTGVKQAVGEYVEVDAPHRVVFTWGWEGDEHLPPGSSTVTIELISDGEGTIVRLTHSGLPEGADAAQLQGWEHFLPRLAIVASGGDPGPDPWVAAP
ncbi:MAG TPA: SRPBCC domain-containing protein [Actinomycetota bacterium]|nr:SRPBCC domain-containing protein [Actinomycetota bacterium]